MAITSINIVQSNITDECNLISVHNPLVFLIDVAYTSAAPELLNVDLIDVNDTVLETFVCIPYSDRTGVRTFAFIADEILRSYMDSIDDFESSEKILEYCEGFTKQFKLEFKDPNSVADSDEVEFVALHAASQFSETPYLLAICNNDDELYLAAEGKPVYLYIYNNDETNIITVGTGDISFKPLLDFDDVVLLDFDDLLLTAL